MLRQMVWKLNMAEHQLAFHIDDETKERLEAEARWGSQSEAEIVEDALKAHLDSQARLRKALEVAAVEADKGVFISSEAMMAWVKDLFDGKKTPPPQPDVFLPPRNRS
jgi:predicted transcriptional regulator